MDKIDLDKIDSGKFDLNKFDLDKVDSDKFDPDKNIRERRAQLFPPEFFLTITPDSSPARQVGYLIVRILSASAARWIYRPLLAIRKTPIRHRIGRASKKNPMK